MIESQFHRIMRKTGRKPSQCKCRLCQSQCKQPCLGTPQDIERIIDAGYADRLSPTEWAVGMILGLCPGPIPMFQATAEENGCAFFKNGLCELHDKGLKPTEGRLSHHSTKLDNFEPKRSISWNVAKEWINPENKEVVRRVAAKILGSFMGRETE